MRTENIIQTLIAEKNYDRHQTERLAAKIDGLSEDIRAALENWLETGEIEGPEYSGYTAQRILNEKPGMTVLAAYLALDWIKNDPKTAIKAILTPVIRFMPNAKK